MKDWSKIAIVDVSYADYRKGRFVKRFQSVDDAVRWIGRDAVMKLRGHYFHVRRDYYDRGWTTGFCSDEYEFRDDLGLKIDVDYLKHRAEIVCKHKKKRYPVRWDGRLYFTYRNGPVPHTRGSGGGGWGGHRSISTYAEIRENDFLQYDEDLEGLNIKYRKKGEIPDSWDDLHNNSYRVRCWKRYRKHQYKEVAKATS